MREYSLPHAHRRTLQEGIFRHPVPMITSTQNSRLKLVRSLGRRPQERRKAGAFLAEGVRLVEEALSADWPARFVLYTGKLSERGRMLVERLKVAGWEVDEVAPSLMNSISETEASQGILAVLEDHHIPIPDSPNFLLIPDQIRDPGNLGNLLRTAWAAGVGAVLLPPETTDAFAPKVVRAGMGAHFRLPVHNMDWEGIEAVCKSAELQVLLADMSGASCWETDMCSPLALIVGGEAQGASQQAHALANTLVSVPMPGKAESLNAGVAGVILMFEVVRQRSL
jgi:TrmH family RNA methyltransferase